MTEFEVCCFVNHTQTNAWRHGLSFTSFLYLRVIETPEWIKVMTKTTV